MAVALPSALQPAIINERISRIRLKNDRLQRFFGAKSGDNARGPAVRAQGGRRGSWDVFNDSRNVADGRMPGAPAGTQAPNPVGRVTFTFPRSANKMPLPLEELHNLRPIGGPVANLDIVGQNYIAEQERVMAQTITNMREFQFAAMLRGSYTYSIVGDRLIHTFSGGGVTVNYQIPANNLGSGVSASDGSTLIPTLWSNTAANVIDNLFAVNNSMEAGTGWNLGHVWCHPTVWQNVLKTTQVQTEAGTANVVFERITKDDNNDFTAVLRAAPWITWHVTAGGLNVDTTTGSGYAFTTLIPTNVAVFMPEPDPSWVVYYEGSEPVVEWVGRPPMERFGEYYWAKPMDDPAGYQLMNVFNGIPALKVPGNIYYLTVG